MNKLFKIVNILEILIGIYGCYWFSIGISIFVNPHDSARGYELLFLWVGLPFFVLGLFGFRDIIKKPVSLRIQIPFIIFYILLSLWSWFQTIAETLKHNFVGPWWKIYIDNPQMAVWQFLVFPIFIFRFIVKLKQNKKSF